MQGRLKLVVLATLLAGTLDLLSAFAFASGSGLPPLAVLRLVASGPLGEHANQMGLAGSLVGLLVHYAIAALMVGVFVIAAERFPSLLRWPVLTGAGYGLILYGVMYLIVLPLRWPARFPQTNLLHIGEALFSHVVCVGIPIAIVTAARMHAPGEPVRARG